MAIKPINCTFAGNGASLVSAFKDLFAVTGFIIHLSSEENGLILILDEKKLYFHKKKKTFTSSSKA